jgi:predicted amidohydrolase
MSTVRIALANIRFPATPEESVTLAEQAIAQASIERAAIICFPECYVPGYRVGKTVPPPDARFLERAWSVIAAAARKANLAVVVGTERVTEKGLLASALVINPDGTIAGFQDKVQLDPSEESTYSFGSGRRVFQIGSLTFGISICHEGWRYPETFRWPARRGAQIVFHPHFHEANPGGYVPSTFADPANTFHEKAILCRAAERGVADHVIGSESGRHAALLPAVRSGRAADRGHRHSESHGPAGSSLDIRLARYVNLYSAGLPVDLTFDSQIVLLERGTNGAAIFYCGWVPGVTRALHGFRELFHRKHR